jgi:hypothetical protein
MTEWGYVWHSLDRTMGQPHIRPLKIALNCSHFSHTANQRRQWGREVAWCMQNQGFAARQAKKLLSLRRGNDQVFGQQFDHLFGGPAATFLDLLNSNHRAAHLPGQVTLSEVERLATLFDPLAKGSIHN